MANVRRLRFGPHDIEYGTPQPQEPTHVVKISQQTRYISVKHKAQFDPPPREATPRHPFQSQSTLGESLHALPRDVQRLVGHIPATCFPRDWNVVTPANIIIATDGSVLFHIGYHSWPILMPIEDILVVGGGPDDGPTNSMTPHRSEQGGDTLYTKNA